MSQPEVRVEDVEGSGGLRVLTLDNPLKRNALDERLLEQLAAALEPTPAVRALLLRSLGGRAFCAGYDLDKLQLPGETGVLPDDRLTEVLLMLEAHPAPSVALVEGPAYGAGCDLASACDFRVGSPAAAFCMPPARLGIVYGDEGVRRLSALVGLPFAKRMFFTGRIVRAEEAERHGLLDVLTEAPESAALELCRELSEAAPLAVAGMKATFRALQQGEGTAELRLLRREAFLSEDAKEGRAAFLEKRRPHFRGV